MSCCYKGQTMETALIWGAAGGIGGALAAALHRDGWQVLGVAREPAALSGLDVPVYAADLGREQDVAAAAYWAAQESGGEVALWVYAAGAMLGRPLADTSAAEWARLLAANITGAHYAVLHSLALVPPGGHMVFLGAYVERILLPKIGAYAAGKAALDAYVQVLAKELRDRRVTLVRAGAVETPLWDDAPFRLPRGAQAPSEVAAAILAAHRDGRRGVLEL
jgi:NAD(P)-dependent dehydrogenase (short-subunit alcohol dehydrogenase family)